MNIIEYAQKNGKYTFSDKEFNVVDSLVLSQLSYLKFDEIIPGPSKNEDGVRISELNKHEKKATLFRDERYAEINGKFLDALCASRRFGSLYLNNFIDVIDEILDIQFSAMTVTDNSGFNYVVFRGTDDSVVGWKEDLTMTFKAPVPAQKYSLEYLKKVAVKIEGDFYVGGHSKGGNLAVYSAMTCSDEIRDRIIHIYSHDGPGFRTELVKNSEYKKITNKITKLVPKAAVVGMMGNMEKYEVVDCEKIGVMQHNPYNWIVDGFDFRRAEHISGYSSFQADVLSMWASEMDDEKWSKLTDWIFGIVSEAGITNLNDLNEDKWKTLKQLVNVAGNTDNAFKEEIKGIIALFNGSVSTLAKEGAKEGMHSAEQSLIQAKDNTIEFIKGKLNEKQ